MNPFAGLYYMHYVHANPNWYESFDYYVPGDEFLRVVRAIVPLTWPLRRSGIWFHASPPGIKLPDQGWKVHVSATLPNCEIILHRAARVCVEQGMAFKFAVDRRITNLMNAKGWTREGSGKFMTIYPLNDDQFKQVCKALYTALQGFDGPYILTDKRYKDSCVLYYRYGGISGRAVRTVTGTPQHVLISPEGDLVPDLRVPFWNPPYWVTDPFPAEESDAGDMSPSLKDGRYQIQSALRFSVVGGIYKATDLDTGATVIIKEARPHTGFDDNGLSAVDRLNKEYRILEKLQDTGITPAPVDLFWDWEHLFLVEEFIPGSDLARLTVTTSPLITATAGVQARETYTNLLMKMWTNLALALETIHARNIVLGDLSMKNVINTNRQSGEIRIIDLEAAWEIGVDKPSPWFRTPGYAPSGGVRAKEDEIFSLGAVFAATVCPSVNSLLTLDATSARGFIEMGGATIGLPKRTHELILDCLTETGERPSTARIVEVLRAPSTPEETPPLPSFSNSRAELLETVDGALNFIRASAEVGRQDRLFPADPAVFMTNPLNISFGAVGVAYALSRITGEVPKPVMSWILSQPVHPDRYPPGLYVGSAGVAWGLWEMGLQEVALNILRSAHDHPLLWDASNLFYGAAGYGMTCLRFHLATEDQEWLDKAVAIGEELLRRKVDQGNAYCWPDQQGAVGIGYAVGSSGIALFLLYLSLATGDDRFLSAGKAGLDHDLLYAKEGPGGVLTIPRGPVGSRDMNVLSHYWVEGSAGVNTALVRFWACTEDSRYREMLNRLAVDAFRSFTSHPGLFRGLSGLGTFLLDAYDFTGEERYLHQAHQAAGGVRLFALQKPQGIAFPGEQLMRFSTDFGTGAAGIALFLHRLADADERVGNFNFTLDQLIHDRRMVTTR